MGKRARLLCSQLRTAFGSAGAVLKIQSYPAPAQVRGLTSTPYDPIKSWPYPEAVRQLSMGLGADVDGPCWRAIAEALPHLRELRCSHFNLLAGSSLPTTPLTALTSLRVGYATGVLRMHSVAALAPLLRSLTVESIVHRLDRKHDTASGDAMWGALGSLRGLQHLHVQTLSGHLTTAAFPSAMQRLTALTHLGLLLRDVWVDPRPSGAALQGFTRALVGLPLLASIALKDFSLLGESLGPALQAVRLLSRLEMSQQDYEPDSELELEEQEEGLPDIAGCLPSISAMPLLKQLRLSGDAIMGSEEFWQLASGGSTSVDSVEVNTDNPKHMPAVCSMLSQLSGLTRLDLTLSGHYYGDHMEQHLEHNRILTHALSPYTQLQHLKIRTHLHGYVPWLASLAELTRLELSFVHRGLVVGDLQVLSSICSLRELDLGYIFEDGGRVLCMEVVRKLPLLEDVRLGGDIRGSPWTEEEVRMLLPPPERLKSVRIILGGRNRSADARWRADVMKQYACYDVDMVIS
jgi:hypothetical protein